MIAIPLKFKLYAAGAVVVLAAFFAWRAHERAVGARDAMLKESARQYAQLLQEKRRVDSVYVRDTVRLTRTRAVTDTVIRRDTLIHRDTVIRLVEAERQACDAVVLSCERRVASRDSLIANLQRQNKLLGQKSRGPGFKTGVIAGAALVGSIVLVGQL